MIRVIDEMGMVVKFNLNHDPHSGEFTSGESSPALERTHPVKFIAARNKTTRPEYLSDTQPADLTEHRLRVSHAHRVGYALDPQGDLQNLFNNIPRGAPYKRGAAGHAIVDAIESGARTLDCYDGYLPKLYRQFGFVETGRMDYNPALAHGKPLPDHPDVVFMAWKGYPETPDKIIARIKQPEAAWRHNDHASKRYTDWGSAKADASGAAVPFRDGPIEKAGWAAATDGGGGEPRAQSGGNAGHGGDGAADGAGVHGPQKTHRVGGGIFHPGHWHHPALDDFADIVKYSEDEARDDHGRWTAGGSEAASRWAESIASKPSVSAQQHAEEYMRTAKMDYAPKRRVPFSESKATSIADAYTKMPHDPQNPDVKKAYTALGKETLAQFQVLKNAGIKVTAVPEGAPDPYKDAGSLAEDVEKNHHMWYYPTTNGFGSDKTFKPEDNLLLHPSDEVDADGRPMLVNDVFRVVHDYFGHVKDGNSFRPSGEENAYRSHASMYSKAALPALTAETRGQNSWVYYGPNGEKNRKAVAPDQVTFADQKTGVLPDWATKRAVDDEARDERGRWASEGADGPPANWHKPSDNAFARGMSNEDVALDWLKRHDVKEAADGRYILYHGTPKENTFTTLAPHSLLETSPEGAKTFAVSNKKGLKPKDIAVLEVHLHPWEFNEGVWASTKVPVHGAIVKIAPNDEQAEDIKDDLLVKPNFPGVKDLKLKPAIPTRTYSEAVERGVIYYAKAANHDGCMIAIRIPAVAARQIAVLGGEKPEDLHVTLAYLGDAADIDSESLDKLTAALHRACAHVPPLEGKICGYGRFRNEADADDETAQDVMWAGFDSPDLPELRHSIVQAVTDAGLELAGDHGFTPHITLAYVDPGEGDDHFPPDLDVTIKHLTLVIGGREQAIQLEGKVESHDDKKPQTPLTYSWSQIQMPKHEPFTRIEDLEEWAQNKGDLIVRADIGSPPCVIIKKGMDVRIAVEDHPFNQPQRLDDLVNAMQRIAHDYVIYGWLCAKSLSGEYITDPKALELVIDASGEPATPIFLPCDIMALDGDVTSKPARERFELLRSLVPVAGSHVLFPAQIDCPDDVELEACVDEALKWRPSDDPNGLVPIGVTVVRADSVYTEGETDDEAQLSLKGKAKFAKVGWTDEARAAAAEARRAAARTAYARQGVWWHGTPTGDLGPDTPHAIHIGSHKAAKQALEARIGIPAEGAWDGTREYGKTLLAGKKSMASGKYGKYPESGYNAGGSDDGEVPDEDYYAHEKRNRLPDYAGGKRMTKDMKPDIFPVKIKGKMTNNPDYPHSDVKANGLIAGSLKRGNAKSGFFYTNEGEDTGSISAVVPHPSHLERVPKEGARKDLGGMGGGVGSGPGEPPDWREDPERWRSPNFLKPNMRKDGFGGFGTAAISPPGGGTIAPQQGMFPTTVPRRRKKYPTYPAYLQVAMTEYDGVSIGVPMTMIPTRPRRWVGDTDSKAGTNYRFNQKDEGGAMGAGGGSGDGDSFSVGYGVVGGHTFVVGRLKDGEWVIDPEFKRVNPYEAIFLRKGVTLKAGPPDEPRDKKGQWTVGDEPSDFDFKTSYRNVSGEGLIGPDGQAYSGGAHVTMARVIGEGSVSDLIDHGWVRAVVDSTSVAVELDVKHPDAVRNAIALLRTNHKAEFVIIDPPINWASEHTASRPEQFGNVGEAIRWLNDKPEFKWRGNAAKSDSGPQPDMPAGGNPDGKKPRKYPDVGVDMGFNDSYLAKYSPDEPRDEHGEWTTGGGSAALPEGVPAAGKWDERVTAGMSKPQADALLRAEYELNGYNRGPRGGTGKEHFRMINTEGETIFQKTIGKTAKVTFTGSEIDQIKNAPGAAVGYGMVMTHNHPIGEGYSFSPADIQFASIVKAGEMRAVGRKAVYRMRPNDPAKGWPAPMVMNMHYNREWAKVKTKFDNGKAEAKTIMAMPAGDERTVAIKAFNKKSLGVNKDTNFLAQHEVWETIAPTLGLTYERHLREGGE